MGMVFITHDLNIVKRIADRVVVMRQGEVVEHGPTASHLRPSPSTPIPRRCSTAEPAGRKAPRRRMTLPRSSTAAACTVTFKIGGGFMVRSSRLVSQGRRWCVARTARQGQTIGIVGESGSGKSTLWPAPCCACCRARVQSSSTASTSRRSAAKRCARFGARVAGGVAGSIWFTQPAHDSWRRS